MAYLFEFISNLFQYVYSIDFLYLMFSSVEYVLLFLAWIFIIVPTILYTTQSYKPKDFLGYITATLFWCVCGFLVILSPISLLSYLFYRHMYMLRKKRKASKSAAHTKVVPPPPDPPASAPSPAKPAAPSYRVCHFMWTRSIIFCEHIQEKPSLQCVTYLWTAFFYSITKHMRNQDLVDEIYSQFKLSAEPFIKDGENKAMSLHCIQSAYWRFRSTLNASGIDPRTQEGISELWSITAQWAFPEIALSKNEEKGFMLNVQLVTNRALEICKLKPAKEHYYFDID